MKVYPEVDKDSRRRQKSQEDVGGVALLAASLRHQTTEFFNNSTLHGVRYIAEKERPFCEKLVFSIYLMDCLLWMDFGINGESI